MMMKRSFISILLSASLLALSCSDKEASVPASQPVPQPVPQPGESYLLQLQPRDSVLIADQLRYGFLLEDVPEGVLPEPLPAQTEKLLPGIRRVSDWQLDTLPGRKGYDIYLTLTSFDAGSYELPPIGAVVDGDTLLFEGRTLEVFNCPVDTTKFTPEGMVDADRHYRRQPARCRAPAVPAMASLSHQARKMGRRPEGSGTYPRP